MPSTHSQIYMHVNFPVKGRAKLLAKSWRDELFKYICGIATNKDQVIMSIGGVEDHIHFLLWMKPTVLLCDVIRDIKANSSRFINQKGWLKERFEWEEGYGVVSVGHTQLEIIRLYIATQEEHHRKTSFQEEYMGFLKAHEIPFKEQFVFDSK